MSLDHRDLIDDDFTWAVQKKYERGKKEHGERWVGPRPLVCLHDEILDAFVYADLEYTRGDVDRRVLVEIMDSLENLRQGIKVLLASLPSSQWDRWARGDQGPS